ncbi:MAG: right-handed parallel beta-helix repeat-containing protein [Opitutae bacterium]|nr:right-handed parallel beta-helix repeat-containing protein [Opitutae bacterium]
MTEIDHRGIFHGIPMILRSRWLLPYLGVVASLCADPVKIAPGTDIQAVLNRGDDALLQPSGLYRIHQTLRFTKAGQSLRTSGEGGMETYATLRAAPGSLATLLDASGLAGITVENVILDGNRDAMVTPDGKVAEQPFTIWGKAGGDRQTLRQCVILNARCGGGWAAVHVLDGCAGFTAENNILFGIGVDVRGNGRSPLERPFGWGDGFSVASRNSMIRNNLIIDPTDEGVMIEGAPGTRVEGNVIVAISREALAGIAMIAAPENVALSGGEKRFDYRGVVVRDNLIDAFGERIHIGVPMGGACWGPNMADTTLVGATVENNTLTGGGCAYGYAANGIEGYTVRGNIFTGTCSGIGDGPPGKPLDAPAPFLFNPEGIGGSQLQPEFKPAQRHITGLLRMARHPLNTLGYRSSPYGEAEAQTIVKGAFLEMLGRAPDAGEAARWHSWLNKTGSQADSLRRALMTTEEFTARHGFVDPLELHNFRANLWMSSLQSALRDATQWPEAKTLYAKAIREIQHAEP